MLVAHRRATPLTRATRPWTRRPVLAWLQSRPRSALRPRPCGKDGRAHRDHGLRPGRARPSPTSSRTRATRSRSSTRTRRRSAGCGSGFRGRRVTGVGFDRDVLVEAGIERGRRLRRGQQRRQLQHHLRPGGPRDVRRRERGGPDLRPPPRRGLPAARHPHRGHRALDRRPDAAPAAARRAPSRCGATRPARCVLAEVHRPRPRGSAPGQRRWRRRAGPGSRSSTGWARRCCPTAQTVLQEGDVAARDGAPRATWTGSTSVPSPAARRRTH